MRNFLAGFLAGLLLATLGTAMAAQLVGGNGYLMGWTVEVNGEEVCSDPFVWMATREIEC